MKIAISLTTALLLTVTAGAAVAAPDEVVVRYAPGADRAAAGAEAGAASSDGLGIPRVYRLTLRPGETRQEAVRELRARGDVQWVEVPSVYRAFRVPSDPLLGRQWALRNTGLPVEGRPAVANADIRATTAWDATVGDPSVTVAVVDSGVAYDHPDLAPNFVPSDRGVDYVADDGDPRDEEGHGTLVAGIIGARGDDGFGTAGVTWTSRLLALRALNAQGEGSSADVAAAFAEAGRRRVRVVNASLGGPASSPSISAAITSAPDTLFVVAAGNDGQDVDRSPSFPCTYPQPNIVCVAATDASDRLASFSNYGAVAVDLAAPGQGITGPSSFGSVFEDDFETIVPGRWQVSAGSTWGLNTNAAAHGASSLSDTPAGPYVGPVTQVLQTAQPFSLAGRAECRLFLNVRRQTDTGDGLQVRTSTDGGESWQTVRAFTGSSQGRFEPFEGSLTSATGRPSVLLRFEFVGTGSGEGVDIDDLRVACMGAPFVANDVVANDGTSFAAPYVAGVAALVAARHPNFSSAQIKQALLEGVVPLPQLAGRVATGGRLDATGALQAADRIALAGRPPAVTPPAPSAPTPSPTVASTRFTAKLAKARKRGRLWSIDLRLSRSALTEITFERRIAGPRSRFVIVRNFGPRIRRQGLFRYGLGRLGPGRYRVTVRLAEERRRLARTFTIPKPPPKRVLRPAATQRP